MSYEIIKGIKIKDNKVFINCACNNVIPHSYTKREVSYFTKILNEQGKEAVEIELLKAYEKGNFQKGTENKYTRALEILKFLYKEEYALFDWRIDNTPYGSEEYKSHKLLRESNAFKDLLLKALNTKMPTEKYIIFNPSNNSYVKKETTRHIFYGALNDAKIYNFKAQTEKTVNWIKGEIKLLSEVQL